MSDEEKEKDETRKGVLTSVGGRQANFTAPPSFAIQPTFPPACSG